MSRVKTYEELLAENEELRWQLDETAETIEAIRTGQVDALVVQGKDGHQLYSLETADHTYRVFIEKMNEGALTLNKEGVILYCNSMFATMLGRPLSKVIGQSFSSFVPEVFHKEYDALFESGWDADGKLETQLIGKERLIPCQLSVTTLQLNGGTALNMILTDLSYQKEVQELLKANNKHLEETVIALEKSNHDLQQFASVASHDLQEPLRKMLMFSSLLKVNLGDDINEEVASYLNKILTSSERMKHLISDILSYSRIGEQQPDFIPTDLRAIVIDIVDDFELLINEKQAIIDIGYLPTIPVSPGQIRQLFQNLISNSLKFAVPGNAPHIMIDSERSTDGFWIVNVKDEGIGIEPQYRDKIFSLFERLNTKDKYDGSGIGLAVAKRIVERHGGSITAIGNKGKGSTFQVRLPQHIHSERR